MNGDEGVEWETPYWVKAKILHKKEMYYEALNSINKGNSTEKGLNIRK